MYHSGLSFADGRTYERGIHILRDVVFSGRERDIRLGQQTWPADARELVTLHLDAPLTPNASIRARIRTADLYLTSVHNGRAGFYFKDHAPCQAGRLQENQVLLGFGSHYNDLGSFESLGAITVGRVDAAIAAIARWSDAPTSREARADGTRIQAAAARHLLLLCLVASEAARSDPIFLTVRNALDGVPNQPLTLAQVDRQARDWDRLSRAGDQGVSVPSERR